MKRLTDYVSTPRPDSLMGQLGSPLPLRWQMRMLVLMPGMAIYMPLLAKGFAWAWFGPTLLSLPFFLYFHAQAYLGPLSRLGWYAAGMTVLGLVLLRVNAAAFFYPIMACMVLGHLPSWRQGLASSALIMLVSVVVAGFGALPSGIIAILATVGFFCWLGSTIGIHALRRDAALRLSQEEVRRLATLAERERIGRDLHDLLGHTLSLVTIKSELARRLALADPPRAQREMEEVERVARHALAEVRTAVTGMRRSDLAAELMSARLMLEASGVQFDGALPDNLHLPEAIEAALALVLREAVTNIHRHARATVAQVQSSIDEGSFQMRISDNGRGGLSAHGNGVGGMRERVRTLGGTLRIDSPPRRGTVLSLCVPLPAQAAAPARGESMSLHVAGSRA